MSIVDGLMLEPMVGDPDDHRPNSRWAQVTDPGDGNGRVEHLAIIREAIAGRDAIPLGRSRYDLRTGAVEPLDDL